MPGEQNDSQRADLSMQWLLLSTILILMRRLLPQSVRIPVSVVQMGTNDQSLVIGGTADPDPMNEVTIRSLYIDISTSGIGDFDWYHDDFEFGWLAMVFRLHQRRPCRRDLLSDCPGNR